MNASALAFAALCLVCCATSKPPAKPEAKPERVECTTEAEAKRAAACYLRVKTECVDKGVPKEDCQALKDCNKAADARLEECRQ